jgi:hypothetical protein
MPHLDVENWTASVVTLCFENVPIIDGDLDLQGASGSSPTEIFIIGKTGDLPVAPTILIYMHNRVRAACMRDPSGSDLRIVGATGRSTANPGYVVP